MVVEVSEMFVLQVKLSPFFTSFVEFGGRKWMVRLTRNQQI